MSRASGVSQSSGGQDFQVLQTSCRPLLSPLTSSKAVGEFDTVSCGYGRRDERGTRIHMLSDVLISLSCPGDRTEAILTLRMQRWVRTLTASCDDDLVFRALVEKMIRV